MSDFRSRLKTSAPNEPKLPEVLADQLETLGDTDDDTTKLLVIPVSQEIAHDFELIGYNDTIRRIEEVLTQRGKQRNIILYGNDGVGKTAIIHGLVQRKNRGDLSTHMFKRMFYRLNSSRLLHMDDVAEINKQFDQALEEFGVYDVMIIENFYTLMTYLKLKGANVVVVGLLEALARRRLQCIITCSTRERTLILNEIPEIHEFFAPEEICEPNDGQLLDILRGIHTAYEARYSIDLPDMSLRTIRDLTQKYRTGMEGWAQPGRALILLDRAIAQFSVKMNSRSPELIALESEIANADYEIQSLADSDTPHDVERRKQLDQRLAVIKPEAQRLREQWMVTTAPIQALQADKSELDKKLHTYITKRRRLADLRGNNAALLAQNTDASKVADEIATTNRMIEIVRKGIKAKDDELAKINLSELRDHVVTPDHISETFSILSGISKGQLNADERQRVLQMEETLGKRVFGQPKAIELVANAVRREKAGLSAEESTPKGSFLFLGPSGVGKTELAKALAEFQTGSEKNLVRLDMSEYKEQHSVSRMIGAPPGYAGYDEGGALTNAVNKQPEAVVVFDEAEKAHVNVFQTLLQVLSDGRLTDGRGDTVDFRETFIILTSNLGARHFTNDELTFEQAEALAMKEVREHFLPEFIGRLDSIISFQRLQTPMLVRVAKRRIEVINRGIGVNQLQLVMDDPDIDRFCALNRDDRYGARPILRSMKTGLENELATAILARTHEGGGVFHARFTDALDMQFEPVNA